MTEANSRKSENYKEHINTTAISRWVLRRCRRVRPGNNRKLSRSGISKDRNGDCYDESAYL